MSNRPPCRVVVASPPDAASAPAVVGLAARLADRLGAELILLAIAAVALPATAGEGLAAIGDRGEIRQDAQERLDAAALARLEPVIAEVPARVAARTVLVRGRPGPAIVLAAREQDAHLVVVGMRRTGRAGHLLHDGADRYVLHHSAVPVVAVPYDTASLNGILPAVA
jgi:nucleotide-binding universal stress UspA family protein